MPGFEDEWPDIQGNILRPYAHPHARYAIVRIDEAVGARRLLTSLLDQRLVTTAARWAPGEKPDATLNVYFSWHGLAAIGLPQESLDSFPEEFRQGMAARWQRLHDPDPGGLGVRRRSRSRHTSSSPSMGTRPRTSRRDWRSCARSWRRSLAR